MARKMFTKADTGVKSGALKLRKDEMNEDGSPNVDAAKERLSQDWDLDDVDHSLEERTTKKGDKYHAFVAKQDKQKGPEQGEEGNPIPARNKKGETADEAVERVKEDNPGKEVEFEDPDTPPPAAPNSKEDQPVEEKKKDKSS